MSPLTIHSTLILKKDDQVWLQTFHQSTGASLFDNSEQFTHFTGFILQEEIVASLWEFCFDYPENDHQLTENWVFLLWNTVWGDVIKYNRMQNSKGGWVFVENWKNDCKCERTSRIHNKNAHVFFILKIGNARNENQKLIDRFRKWNIIWKSCKTNFVTLS